MLVKIRDIDKDRAEYFCECGAITVKWKSNVNTGHTKSCGCARKAATAARSTTHGHKVNRTPTKAYAAWVNMKTRCNRGNRPDAKNYIDRGIGYDPRWELFRNFLEDMGEPEFEWLSIDRIDNEKGYSKDNCRWADSTTQNLNKRNNVRYKFNEQNLTLTEWEKITGVGSVTMLKRIQRGVPLELALFYKGYLKMNR